MAIQLSTAVRNAMLDAIETTVGTSAKIRILTGSQPANCAAPETGTLLVQFSLASDWATNAASGAKAFAAITGVVATGTGFAGYYRLMNSAGTTCHEQGSISVTGGGGDMTIDNTSIASGQTVDVTGWTWTQPGA